MPPNEVHPLPPAPVLRARESRARWELVARLLAVVTIVLPAFIVVWPWLADMSTYGFHDWDVQTSHRYLVKKSILEYGEFPGWNPYACGGFPAWGYVEAGTIVVSPWLPAYLFADMRTALRVEVLGMALLGAVGAYMLAGRFTESRAARALVVVLWATNGRWALQIASGHTWHLAYALMPWCWFFFERARTADRLGRDVVLGGAAFALLVYAGGIYPLPHTVLLVFAWAVGASLLDRSGRPLVRLAAMGAMGAGLAAPKLLPLLSTFDRAPRLIESTETMSLGAFVTMLTSRAQAFYDRPAEVAPYGWHEWGIYVSSVGAAALAAGVLLVAGRRENTLKLIGVVFVVLGFGAFHEAAPWTLLHQHVPVFRSQHVPSRFLYPAVLVLGLVAAVGLGRLLAAASQKRPWAEVVALCAVLAIGCDVALVAQKPMKDAMWMRAPRDIPADRPFHFTKEPPFHYVKRDWAGPMYLAMLGNTGVLNCYGAPPFEGKGALSSRDRRYRGEVQMEGEGRATLTRWSPNSALVTVEGASEDAQLVYNMNFDPGWTAAVTRAGVESDAPVAALHDRVSVVAPPGDSTIELSYEPPGLRAGVALATVTALAVAAFHLLRRRLV